MGGGRCAYAATVLWHTIPLTPFPPITPHAQTRVWQALAVLAGFVRPPHIRPAVEGIMAVIGGNQPPSVKQYLEGVMAGLLLKQV